MQNSNGKDLKFNRKDVKSGVLTYYSRNLLSITEENLDYPRLTR